MSYLDVPRLHFAGKFQADPSTVNNNDANFDPTVALSNQPPNQGDPTNTSVYWNPNGTHNWKLLGCTVRGVANDKGQFSAPAADPLIGANVTSSGAYPAKLVDLDPDNQGVSQIWGLQLTISIPDPKDATKVLASVTGTMPATAFGDLWNRARHSQPGMPTMCAAFQAVLQNIQWVTPTASPILAALNAISPGALSIRFNVDSYQPDSTQSNFTFGRIVGTIGPVKAGDAPRSTARRIAPAVFFQPQPAPPRTPGGPPSIMSDFGPAGASWDAQRHVMILDLGNCVPTDATPPKSGASVPDQGWPLVSTQLQLTACGLKKQSYAYLKSGGPPTAPTQTPTVLGTITVDTTAYLTYAGVVEVPIAEGNVPALLSQLALVDAMSTAVAQEDEHGRYVDVDIPFVRLDPTEQNTVTLWATKYGAPWQGAVLDLALQAEGGAGNGGPWNNSSPQSAVALSSNGNAAATSITATTDKTGSVQVLIAASDPGTPRTYPDGQSGPDGQVYWVSGSWASYGQIFLFAGAPINLLLFSGYPMPANPNWNDHVGPILSNYARMYPYMKSIIDLADYDTVVGNAAAIAHVLNLPRTDPHHMPIVRDLSRDKLAMINAWFKNGTPRSAPSVAVASAAAAAPDTKGAT